MTSRACTLLVALLLPAAAVAQFREATILFKDGYVLSGKVMEKRDFLIDPASKAMFQIPSGSGFMYLDDEARRIVFTPSQVQEVVSKKLWTDLITLTRYAPKFIGGEVLPTWQFQKFGNWNAKWERSATFLTFGGTRQLDMDQRITLFTPRHIRVDSLKYNWALGYMTRELGAESVRTMLYQYYSDKKDIQEPQKRLFIARFLNQAGWHDLADKEIAGILDNFPEVKEVAQDLRDSLKKQRSQLLADDIERAHKLGQHELAQERMTAFFKNDLGAWIEGQSLLNLQDLKNKYEMGNDKIKQVTALLREFPRKAQVGQKLWTEATDSILAELNHDTRDRLETFHSYAEQHLRQVKEGAKPAQSAEEVLALAVTGWILGNIAAEPDVKTAALLWRTRQAVLELQKTDNFQQRTQLAQSLTAEKDVTCDLVARVIRQLPPPAPMSFDKADAGEPISVKYDAGGFNATYLVHLPPDYHPQRQYPVVVLLHGPREKPADFLSRWTEEASKRGYILAAPLWATGFKGSYNYTAREHALVTDCVRDLRRRFQIDSDRVFLTGWEQGAEFAYDVGIAHPDQFAGVLPMSGAPKFFPTRCWSNAQYLPFYAIDGEKAGVNPKLHKMLFKDWIRNHYPCMFIEYKGRLSEWFEGEVPLMFDWMDRKKRANPLKELGRFHTGGGAGEEFKSMRNSDTRFYWLSTDSIKQQHLNDAASWGNLVPPATLQANVTVGNEAGKEKANIWTQINVRVSGVNGVSIWLSPSMIDFSKPVSVRVNGAMGGIPKLVPQNLALMLEDFYQNGDRQRLYFARIDLK